MITLRKLKGGFVFEFSRPAVVMLTGIVLISACRSDAAPPAVSNSSPAELSAADVAAIQAADSAFVSAANAGDLDALTRVYASNASLLPPNLPPQKGLGAIRAFWGGFLKAYSVKFEIGSDTIEGRGDLAYNVGHYRFTAVPKSKDGAGVADEGKFVEILKKQPDGSWKYLVDMYSSNLAPQN
jgi:ketosteroid isomerase-like protein